MVLVYTGAAWTRIAPLYEEGTFTPTFTFATPGDLSVVYTEQSGVYRRVGNLVTIDARVSFTPTYTTASGNGYFGGLPYPAAYGAFSNLASRGVFQIGGTPTWPAGATQILSASVGGQSYIYGQATGSGVNSPLLHTFFTSGAARVANYSLTYPV